VQINSDRCIAKRGRMQRAVSISNWLDRVYTIPGMPGRYHAMEGLRAYAAFIVFLVHYAGEIAATVYGVRLDDVAGSFTRLDWPLGLLQYLHRSQYGVDLFFLLSGFLVYKMITAPNARFGAFFINRVWRIYPVFIVTEALYVAMRYEQNGVFWPGGVIGNLLLLNGVPRLNFPAYNYPTWSLFFEFASYVVIPGVVSLLPNHWNGVTRGRVAALAIIVAAVSLGMVTDVAYIRFMMFSAGILLATTTRAELERLACVVPDGLIAVVYLASTTLFAATSDFLLFIPVYFVTALLFVNQTMFGCGFLKDLFSRRIVRYFGNISLSFYLIHGLCLYLVFRAVRYDPAHSVVTYAVVIFVLGMALSIISASVLFVAVEKRYFYWKHGRRSTNRAVLHT
jgi:peptidoglycan/LPS O-acetylase OafA/YrhL